MKTLLVLLLMMALAVPAFGYPKMPLVERFTNASCGPCAVVNNGWYTVTSDNLEEQGHMNHVIYNVNWPGPLDPMYLLNPVDNMARRGFYLVDAVPWIEINGVTFTISGNNTTDANNFTTIVNNSFNSGYAPFSVAIDARRYSSDIVDVDVTITRDPADSSILPANVTLQIAVLENMVSYATPPGTNGERNFPDVCRKMLDDGTGTVIAVPAAGGSVTITRSYVPTSEAQGLIDFSNLRVLAFVQNAQTQEVYQSAKVAPVFTDAIHAAFRSATTAGATPFAVTYEDLSSPQSTRPITSWAWDMDSDGDIDATDPEPTYVYTTPGVYDVTLTVGDGVTTHTSTRENYVYAITNQADILVVNGIEYVTYAAEMAAMYNASAVWGAHDVDIWDLFGDQGYNYEANPSVQQVLEMRRKVPASVMELYRTIIWVGNNYSGDLDYWDATQILNYVQNGGNVILATRMGSSYFTTALRQYCGVNSLTSDLTVAQLTAIDPNLVNMPAVGANSLVHLASMAATTEAVTIFRDPNYASLAAGFRLQKEGDGTFIYVAGRPYRYNTAASYQNYDYMLNNWMGGGATGVGDGLPNPAFALAQNQPNPFNPATQIRFSLVEPGHVSLRVYDAAGRHVRTLVDEPRAAAEHVVTWDGKNDNGAAVAAGVYLYKLQTDRDVQTRRMVLVK